MSPTPTDRRKTGPSQLPYGYSADEAQHWLKRGSALGTLLNLLLRHRTRTPPERSPRAGETIVGRPKRM